MLEVMRVEEPPVWKVGEEVETLSCPWCGHEKEERLWNRLETPPGEYALIYKCKCCKQWFAPC